MKHIQALLNAETSTKTQHGGNIRFDRINDNTIVVSCSGYNHMDLNSIEETLLKLGCKYDLKKGVQKFDSMSGRTSTYMIEPK